jgi:glycosyltransferase involved in cell wall biosynthesis
MHVLQINNHHRVVGGSDNVYLNTGSLLEDAGHEVSYFAARSEFDDPCEDSNFFCNGLDTKKAGPKDALRFLHNPAAQKALENMLSLQSEIEIAHLHIYYGRLTPAILRPLKKCHLPVVQTLHEYKTVCPTYTMERRGNLCDLCITGTSLNCIKHRCKEGSIAKSTLIWMEHNISKALGSVRCIDRFICVSDFQRGILIKAGLPEHKLRTLHNFINTEALMPAKIQSKQDYLLYIGRIETLKGLLTLLAAAEETGSELKIAGNGSWAPELAKRVSKMRNVEYLGFVSGEPLKQLVQRARAVVVPSEWYETFGLTAAEAKAVGTPVIASRIGGLTEVVRDGIDGILFEPGNALELATAIDSLRHRDTFHMGIEGMKDVAKRFSPQTHMAGLLSIYNEATDASGR